MTRVRPTVTNRRVAPDEGAFVLFDDPADAQIVPAPTVCEGDADDEPSLWTLVGEIEFNSSHCFGSSSRPARHDGTTVMTSQEKFSIITKAPRGHFAAFAPIESCAIRSVPW